MSSKLKYHNNCFLNFTYEKSETAPGRTRSSEVLRHNEIIRTAFQKVLAEINHKNKVFELSFLCDKTNIFIGEKEKKIENKKMKKFLMQEYEDKILFSDPAAVNKSCLVGFDFNLIELFERLNQVDIAKNKILDVVEIFKNEMQKVSLHTMEKYVCDENVIDKLFHEFELPPMWKNFFQALFCNKQLLSDNKLIYAKALFMDFFYIMNKKITPKHIAPRIALLQTAHHLFRSKHLIEILSKLGHSINYIQLLCYINKNQLSQKITLFFSNNKLKILI